MLKEIFFKHQHKKQLLIAILGSFIGFVFLLTSVHYYIKSKQLGEGKEILGSNLLILQKKISKFNTLGLNSNTFSQKEIKEIKSLPFITKADPILNNKFGVSLGMREEGLPYFRTDIYVQSVSSDLMDIQVDNWHWDKSKKKIPLVMPRDFMVMLNQFAASYHIPQVSEDLAKTFNFRLDISGNNEKEGFDAQIIGFSNQISAILVPIEFMDYANKLYGDTSEAVVSQMMISVKTGSFGQLQEVMDDKNLDVKKSEMMITKVKSILSAVLGVLLIIGILIVLLSALVVFQYSQLLISKADYEINVLLRLGYHPKALAKSFLTYFTKIFGGLFIASCLGFIGLKFVLDHFAEQSGFSINGFPSITAFLILLLTVISIIAINYMQVKQSIVKKIKIVK